MNEEVRDVIPLRQDPEFQEWFKDLLNEEVVTVKFEKSDGTLREMTCTTAPFRIPEEKAPKGVREIQTTSTQRVFDLEKQEWRSFKWDSLLTVEFKLEV